MNRSEEVKTERRRRRGDNVHMGQQLGVAESFLDRENYEYRWVNDDGMRIEQRTEQDDWDLVDDPKKVGKPDADGLGTKVSKVVGRNGDSGIPMRAYLARKPKQFYEDDQAEKGAHNKALMDTIKAGRLTPDGAAPLGDNGYVPNGPTGIQIQTKDRR